MPKKKNKNSRYTGFYWYMQELMPTLKKEGRVKYGGIEAVVPVARPMWKALTKQEQDKYERIAKEMKRKDSNNMFGLPKYRDDSERLDNVGNIIADRVDTDKEDKEQRIRDRKWAKSRWPSYEEMLDFKFYFIGFEYLCELEEGDFLPCEVAIVEWNMRNGIMNTFHRFIDTGGIPMGYRYTCQQHSEETHQIPIEGFEKSDNNYRGIWIEMENFINPNGAAKDFPPVYCAFIDWRKNQAISMLDWLHAHACIGRPNCINKVFVLEDCLQDLATLAGHDISDGSASNVLMTSVFDYESHTRCAYHQEIEVRHCALGTAKKNAFAIGDFLCQQDMYNFQLTSAHLPTRDSSYDTITTIPPNRVYMEPYTAARPGPPAGSAWGRGASRAEEDNGPFASRDIRYKQPKQHDKVEIYPNDDSSESDSDIASQFSYSSKMTAASLESDYQPKQQPWQAAGTNNPFYKPDIEDVEEFPTLGGSAGEHEQRKYAGRAGPPPPNRVPAPSFNGDQPNLGWQPSSAYLEQRKMQEAFRAQQPTLSDMVKQNESQQPTQNSKPPAAGRGYAKGRGLMEPVVSAQQQPPKPAAANPVNPWAQGARRGEGGPTRGRGRGSWVPKADADMGGVPSSASSIASGSTGATRPPPGFGRGLSRDMAGLKLN